MKRGIINKKRDHLVAFWVPENVLPLIDAEVLRRDSDRSKFIREAIREKLGLQPRAAK